MPVFSLPRSGRSLVLAAFVIAVARVLAVAPISIEARAAEDWTTYQNPRFGYSLSYPSRVFTPQRASEDGGGQVFLTANGSAKLAVYGALNDKGFSPTEYRKIIIEDYRGYDQMDYSPQGKTWFVLSGFRGDTIYYQKVIFSCENRVISAFSITFPKAEKKFYEGIVEIMEDQFKTGTGEGCR